MIGLVNIHEDNSEGREVDSNVELKMEIANALKEGNEFRDEFKKMTVVVKIVAFGLDFLLVVLGIRSVFVGTM